MKGHISFFTDGLSEDEFCHKCTLERVRINFRKVGMEDYYCFKEFKPYIPSFRVIAEMKKVSLRIN